MKSPEEFDSFRNKAKAKNLQDFCHLTGGLIESPELVVLDSEKLYMIDKRIIGTEIGCATAGGAGSALGAGILTRGARAIENYMFERKG